MESLTLDKVATWIGMGYLAYLVVRWFVLEMSRLIRDDPAALGGLGVPIKRTPSKTPPPPKPRIPR